ncbi:MAG TPA: histidine phosphatase family protein [Parvibaculum sp.]
MPILYMIRHGEAASGWDADMDPGLSAKGRTQSEDVARDLSARIGRKLPLITSPLRRCRETSAPLARQWSASPHVEARVGEIPSPTHDLEARGKWLRAFMAGTWSNDGTGVDFLAWRKGVVEALMALKEDTVIFSHFIAINVAAGNALKDDRVVCFRPDNCSVTIFDTKGGKLSMVEQGREAETKVN